MKVVTHNQRYMGDWLVRILNAPLPEDTRCIGQEKDGNLIAVVGFTNFLPNACEIHIGSVGDHWATRDFIWAAFDYPFNQLQMKTLIGQVCSQNEQALRLDQHLGFKKVCEIENAHRDGDLTIFEMKKEQCKWLNLKCPLRTRYEQEIMRKVA